MYLLYPRIRIKELIPLNLEGGYLIDGIPSTGISSTMAAESLIHTSNFELGGIIDSENFPIVSLIKNGLPNYPTRIFVNNEMKVAVFSSFLTLHESMYRTVARLMLRWAKKHNISLIISSVAIKSEEHEQILAAGSTDEAREKIKKAGLKILEHGTIPGIPGLLLNEGNLNNQDVIVILFQTSGNEPDFKSSAQLCLAISNLIPGAACDISALQKEAEIAEHALKEADEEARHLKDSMYR